MFCRISVSHGVDYEKNFTESHAIASQNMICIIRDTSGHLEHFNDIYVHTNQEIMVVGCGVHHGTVRKVVK
jgi:hypothetical protein